MKKDLVVFVSQPMTGKRESEVMANIRHVSVMLQKMLPEFNIKMIDNYHHKDMPANAPRIAHLGESIKQMAKADLVVFAGDWMSSSGCGVESTVCIRYHIPYMYFSGDSKVFYPHADVPEMCDITIFADLRRKFGVAKETAKKPIDKDSISSRILGR